MRLFYISFALLLYANLTHAVDEKDKCIEVDYVPTQADCEKNHGRCKADDHTLLCSNKKKGSETTTICCKPHSSELCYSGVYPFGVKGKNGLVDWIAFNTGERITWRIACENLATKPEFAGAQIFLFDYKCCAKAKLNETAYYGKDYADLLTDKYERISTDDCKNDDDCVPLYDDSDDVTYYKFCGTVTSSYKNEPSTGKACFEKIRCPHKNATIYPVRSTDDSFICIDSSTCPEGAICVWGKPAAATATKIKKSFGMCCSKAAYEEMCTTKFLGNPLHNKTGLIDPAILTRENCQHFTQKWGTLDTGAGGTGEDKTGVCCQYKDVPPPPTPPTTRSQETEGSTDSLANNNHGLQFHFCPVILFLSLFR